MAKHVDEGDISPSPAVEEKPRTPASASAVRDGRSLLAAFRHNKRERRDGGSSPSVALPAKSQGCKTIDYVESYKSRAPVLARNLETALDASLASRKPTSIPNTIPSTIPSTSTDNAEDAEDDGGFLGTADGKRVGGEVSSSDPNGNAVGPSNVEALSADGESSGSDDGGGSGDEGGGEASSESTNGDAVRPPDSEVYGADGGRNSRGESTAAAAAPAAAADVATAVVRPSPPRNSATGGGSGSPAGPTPEVRTYASDLALFGAVAVLALAWLVESCRCQAHWIRSIKMIRQFKVPKQPTGLRRPKQAWKQPQHAFPCAPLAQLS